MYPRSFLCEEAKIVRYQCPRNPPSSQFQANPIIFLFLYFLSAILNFVILSSDSYLVNRKNPRFSSFIFLGPIILSPLHLFCKNGNFQHIIIHSDRYIYNIIIIPLYTLALTS